MKAVSRFLILALAAGLALTACGGSGDSAGSAQSAQGETGTEDSSGGEAAAPQDGEPIEIRFMFDLNVPDQSVSLQDNRYVDYIQEASGYKVVMESPGGTGSAYNEKLNVLLAAGNPPDVFQISVRNDIMRYGYEGMLEDLAPYIYSDEYKITEYMPEGAWAPVTSGENIWAFPYNRQDAMNQTMYVRRDWMENLNLEVPKTIEEFYEVLRAFTHDDPDGNGEDDTFGLISEMLKSDFGYLRPFAAAYDAIEYKIIDGKVIPPEVTEEYRDCLRFLNRLATENILDKEFITYNTQMHVDRLKTNKYGMTGEFWHFDHSPEYLMPDESRPFGNKVPDTWMTIDFPLRVADGQPSKIAYTTTNRHYLCVSKGYDRVKDVMGFFEWCISEEGTKLNYLGVPGIEYTEENGEIKPLEEKVITQWNYFTPVKQGNFREDKEKFWMSAGYDSEAVKRLEHAIASGKMDYIQAMLPFDPDLPLFNTDKIRNEYREKAILGNADLEADWDNYVANWYASGGQQVVDFYTDWYNSGGKEMVEAMG